MKRNVDAIALVCIGLLLLLVQTVSSHVNAVARASLFDGMRCPQTRTRVVLPEMPRVELPDLPQVSR